MESMEECTVVRGIYFIVCIYQNVNSEEQMLQKVMENQGRTHLWRGNPVSGRECKSYSPQSF